MLRSYFGKRVVAGVVAGLVGLTGLSGGPVAHAQSKPTEELLWPQGIPGVQDNKASWQPKITIHQPATGTGSGTAVVICPGGGYQHLAVDHEGKQIAQWFNQQGICGIVLEYRHAKHGYRHPAPLQDVQRAIRTVRSRAKELFIHKDRIGVIGFSAGGHLASTVSTHFDSGNPEAKDPIDQVSCRPDFAILCYPVISLKSRYTHVGSRRNLLGENPDAKLLKSLSTETQVTDKTPPTFLFHTTEDKGVPVQNSLVYYYALVKAGVPAELHVFEKGKHGLGLARTVNATGTWPILCTEWMRTHRLLE